MPKRRSYIKRIVLISASALFLCILTPILLYTFNDGFREAINDLRHTTYSNLVIEPTMNDVATIRSNIPYCNGTSKFQKLDVYTPKQSNDARPAVVYIHGGGWSSGDKSNPFVVDYGAELVHSNIVFISINYRLAPKAVYPAQNQDVDCALAYILAHSSELHVDASKIALMGDSAGAELAAMAALTSANKAAIRAVVDFYGPADIWAQITRKPRADQWAINYIGSATNQALARQASPAFADLTGAPPFLIMHGTDDQTVHYDQSTNFAQLLRAAGDDVTLVPVQHANHYFSKKSSPNINDIEAQMISFLKQHLGV